MNLLEQPQVAPQEETKGLTTEQWRKAGDDTIAVDRRAFDEAAINAYMKDGDLDYDQTHDTEDLWSARFWRWIERLLQKLFGTKAGAWIWDNLQYMILIAAVIFLLYFFRKKIFVGAFTAPPVRGRSVTVVEEDISVIDLDALLADAEQKKRWSLALRYHYLKVLRRLVDEGAIEWKPRNTDQDYLAQLKDPALRAVFSDLSFTFKWIWYGDAPMDEARYVRLKQDFEAFHRQHAPAK